MLILFPSHDHNEQAQLQALSRAEFHTVVLIQTIVLANKTPWHFNVSPLQENCNTSSGNYFGKSETKFEETKLQGALPMVLLFTLLHKILK